jgi:hypothetical protein
MSAYIIYFIIAFIFLFLIFDISKAISRGVEAKDKVVSKEKKYFLGEETKPNIVDKIKRLKELREDKILSEIEFKKQRINY